MTKTLDERFDRFMEKMRSCCERWCPKESDFTIVLIQDRETGKSVHISTLDPLDEAAGLRELAGKLERREAEKN